MSEGQVVENIEVLPLRKKEDIKRDIDNITRDISEFEKTFEPLDEQIDSLSEDRQQILDSLGQKYEKGELKYEDVEKECPPDLVPLVKKIIDGQNHFNSLNEKQYTLQQEYTPYIRQEFEEKLKSLSSRINYDAVFNYYQEMENNIRKQIDNHDILSNAVNEMYELRVYQHEIINGPDKEADYFYFNNRCRALEHYEKEWQKKGFLLEKPIPDYKFSNDFGEKPRQERQLLIKEVESILAQLKESERLSNIYHGVNYTDRSHVDYGLQDVLTVMANKYSSGHPMLYGYLSEKFEQIDYDPKFILAARKNIQEIRLKHERAGRISKSRETLEEERKRIDSINTQEVVNNLKIEGLTPPEGMTAVITQEEIVNEIKDLLPPDFMRDLKKISHLSQSEKRIKDGPDTETVGLFIPIRRGEGENWDEIVATEIEIYRELFITEDVNQVDRALIRSEFLGTVFHEFGHNAHYKLDYDEMIVWDKLIDEDKTAITWYVKYARKEDPEWGKREDFADSFKLFLTMPGILYTLSPSRYQYMREYFERHLQTQNTEKFSETLRNKIIKTFALWKYLGYSQEYIKSIYLSHEKEE